jgi:ubiquinol-cytochrome c reductase cytochrome c1 subunit
MPSTRPAVGSAIAALAAVLIAGGAGGAPDMEMEGAGNDIGNVASLQRGARNFMYYCAGCHSAQYVRYNSVGKGLELSEDHLVEYLMFNAEKTFETIQSSMPREDAARWFGQAPPDMSLIARAKGTDYLYNFMRGFYLDAESPTGVDNLYLPGTSMPHVLWELQGYQAAVFEQPDPEEGGAPRFVSFESLTEGTLSAEDYDAFVRDTVNFLEYISEPVRSTRRILGVWVLLFLTLFLIIASMLKNQIWRDVS